jgi:hypothetical protein
VQEQDRRAGTAVAPGELDPVEEQRALYSTCDQILLARGSRAQRGVKRPA